MKKLLTATAVASLAMVGAASAATYSIDSLIRSTEGGFGSSLLHSQDYNGDMSGERIGYFAEEADGMWYDNGDIHFSGIFLLEDDGPDVIEEVAFSAKGNISQDTAGGMLNFFFDVEGGIELKFSFDGALDMAGLPNSFKNGVINLWGETGDCSDEEREGPSCVGTDLRIGVSELPEVPLPASAFLLMAGVGALGVARRKKA